MIETVLPNNVFSFLNRAQLLKLKLRAVRAGVWFRALRRIDQVLIDLTIKVTDTVRSAKLSESLLGIVRKLEGAMESCLSRAFREVGLPHAQSLSMVAQKWGNVSAAGWAFDCAFAVYLAVMHLNGSKTFKT